MYKQLLQKLFDSTRGKGMHLGLDHVIAAHRALGSPAEKYKTIHIAGTNGKGSVSTKIAAACAVNGYKTGLFTSPHISTFRERIRVNGVMISEEEVAALLPILFQIAPKATFFEITTLLAFVYFAQMNVDIAVIETGIGGRLDATNIITPILSVITSIGFDHCEILGDTLEKIAFEKAGIIKEGVPVVLGPRINPALFTPLAHSVKGSYRSFDEENNATVIAALQILQFPQHAIEQGIKSSAPCRMETIYLPDKKAPLILDVGHNPDGLERLFSSLKEKYPDHQFRVLCGLSSGKDLHGCLQFLASQASHIHLIQSTNGRGAPVAELVRILSTVSCSHTPHDSIASGLNSLLGDLQEKEIPVICGSFFIMGPVRELLSLSYPTDPFDVNERST